MGRWTLEGRGSAVVVTLVGLVGCADKSLVGDEPTRPPDAGTRASGDGGTMPPRQDAGVSTPAIDAATGSQGPDGRAPTTLPTPVPLIEGTIDAVDLLADGDGLYWLSSADELWMLSTGAAAPRRLSAGGGELPGACGGGNFPARIATTGTDVFWIGQGPSAVRRTSKDGAADVILANGLAAPATIAVDDAHVFWSENTNPGTSCQGNGVIRALPQTAAPGTNPASLAMAPGQDIATLAVKGGALYWAAFDAPGSTIYQGAWIWTAPISALPAGAAPTQLGLTSMAYALVPSAGRMYVAYVAGEVPWATSLAEFTRDDGPLELVVPSFEDASITSVAVIDESWLALSVSGSSPHGTERQLYVAPTTGAGMVLAAVGLETDAVAGPTGPTFVDASGHLVALPLPPPGADVRRPIAFEAFASAR